VRADTCSCGRLARVQAYAQVTTFGMSDKLGHVSFQPDESDNQFTKPFSESTAQVIDAEVQALVRKCYDRTIELATSYKEKIEALALRLLKDETINHDVIVEVLGKRPFTTQVCTRGEAIVHVSARSRR
jgi:AFG3 family protein